MGWNAALELGFEAERGLTRLARRAHRGPLYVQRPFLPEGPEICHVYLLHPPGGLVGGDELAIDLAVGPGAHVLATTPAAGKAYRTTGAVARQRQVLRVAVGGSLEWLPQETILYDGADVVLETRVELDAGASFLGAETLAFGLPARGEPFARGSCRQAFEVWRQGRPLCLERGRFAGGGTVHGARWGLGGATVIAVLVATPVPGAKVIEALRAQAAALPFGAPPVDGGEIAAVTVLPEADVLVCRYLGGNAARARIFLQDAWRLLRPALWGRPPSAPRIWAT